VSLDPRLPPREDADAAAILERRFAAEGVALRLGAKILRADRCAGAQVVVFERDGLADEAVGDEILVAVGRAPNVEGLELGKAGVAYGHNGVQVDDRLRTTNRRVYAAGDVCSAYEFTHAIDAMARVVLQNALFFGRKKASALVLPSTAYTDPEIAHVGLHERQAQERGIHGVTFTVPLHDVDRAVLDGDADGFARVQRGSPQREDSRRHAGRHARRRDDRGDVPRHHRGPLTRRRRADHPPLPDAGGGVEAARRRLEPDAAHAARPRAVRAFPRAMTIGVDEKGVLCVFAKPPRPGEVKTRLAETLGAAPAAALARAFFLDTWRSATSCAWARAILATTDAAAPEWAGISPIWAQGGGDLGERLERVLFRALRSAPFAVAIGTDTPGLPTQLLESAWRALATADAVLGPCEDGGFYLIGLRRCPPGLLAGLPWSAEDTFVRTIARLREHGLAVETLPPWFDVDRAEDLSCVRALLSRGEIEAPETERALRTIAIPEGGGGCA
jgi:rSAM/selenodomain-associated transferase 1